jgi:hypothetical protein
MKVNVNGMWCDTKTDWGYKNDEEFVVHLFNENEKNKTLLKEEESRTELFEGMMNRALKLWKEENPNTNYWPDGAVNVVWVLDKISKLELYNIFIQDLIKICENPKYRTHTSLIKMCGFLDDIRASALMLLNE